MHQMRKKYFKAYARLSNSESWRSPLHFQSKPLLAVSERPTSAFRDHIFSSVTSKIAPSSSAWRGKRQEKMLGPLYGCSGVSRYYLYPNAVSALRRRLHEEFGGMIPARGVSSSGTFETNPEVQQHSIHVFGARFAEVRVPRLLEVFAAGRIVNPKTARSQFLGGMTWGLSMALHEESVLDPRFGDYVNHDFAEYHIATNADVEEIDVSWIDEEDPPYKYRFFDPKRGNVPAHGVFVVCGAPFPCAFSSSSRLQV